MGGVEWVHRLHISIHLNQSANAWVTFQREVGQHNAAIYKHINHSKFLFGHLEPDQKFITTISSKIQRRLHAG